MHYVEGLGNGVTRPIGYKTSRLQSWCFGVHGVRLGFFCLCGADVSFVDVAVVSLGGGAVLVGSCLQFEVTPAKIVICNSD